MKRCFSGYVYTWGDSYNFFLGHNTRQPILTPKKLDLAYKQYSVTNMTARFEPELFRRDKDLPYKFSSISTGPLHTILITEQGQLYGFGEDIYNKRGHEFYTLLPERILGLAGCVIRSVSCGLDFTLALDSSGKVYSWGYGGENDSLIHSVLFKDTPGALGHGNFRNYTIPTVIPSLEDIIQVEAGFYHSIALTSKEYLESGHVFSWGNNEYSQLGYPCEHSHTPRPISLKGISKISAARNYSVALTNTGEVYVWGQNHYGQLGNSSQVLNTPTLIASNCQDIEAGEGALMMVFEDYVKIAGFKKHYDFVDVELPVKPAFLAVGDIYAAIVDSYGEVHSIGGLFTEEKRSAFFVQSPEMRFKKAAPGFFPGRVKKLFGKYSYHAAIIDA